MENINQSQKRGFCFKNITDAELDAILDLDAPLRTPVSSQASPFQTPMRRPPQPTEIAEKSSSDKDSGFSSPFRFQSLSQKSSSSSASLIKSLIAKRSATLFKKPVSVPEESFQSQPMPPRYVFSPAAGSYSQELSPIPKRFSFSQPFDDTYLNLSNFPKSSNESLSPFDASFADGSQAGGETPVSDSELSDLISFKPEKRITRYKLLSKRQPIVCFPLLHKEPPMLAVSVGNLYCKIRSSYSDYGFSYAISAQMCQDLLPMDAYVTLKQSLLLSIISAENHSNTNVAPMSIIAIGKDSSSVALIMNRIGGYAQRFTSPLVLKNSPLKNPEFIEPGPLQIARNGVCYAGEWSRLKPACFHFLQKVLDSGQVPAANFTMETPLECSIWMHWTCCAKSFKKKVNDVATFLNLFGIPIVIEDNLSDSIVNFLFEQAMKGSAAIPDSESNIPRPEMESYLRLVSQKTVTMSDEAEDLLKKYFLATRNSRRDALSQRGLLMLRQLSEAHAKLCWRDTVLRNDVLVSISIAEKFISGIFGAVYEIAPQPGVITHIEQVETYMAVFEEHLLKFINTVPGSSSANHDEDIEIP